MVPQKLLRNEAFLKLPHSLTDFKHPRCTMDPHMVPHTQLDLNRPHSRTDLKLQRMTTDLHSHLLSHTVLMHPRFSMNSHKLPLTHRALKHLSYTTDPENISPSDSVLKLPQRNTFLKHRRIKKEV